MVHSVSGCTRNVQVKLWDPLRTCAISERLRGVIMTNAVQIHVYLYLYRTMKNITPYFSDNRLKIV